jgi:hypothetical protein
MTARIPVSMSALYETDFVLWTEKTAEQLRQKNFAEVDWENVIEEIESMGRSERQTIVSLLTVLIEHLLKLTYWESERARSARHWLGEIANCCIQLKQKIDSTTLANHARGSFEKAYSDARKALIAAGYVRKDAISLEPTFSLEQALDLNWFPIDIESFLENRD